MCCRRSGERLLPALCLLTNIPPHFNSSAFLCFSRVGHLGKEEEEEAQHQVIAAMSSEDLFDHNPNSVEQIDADEEENSELSSASETRQSLQPRQLTPSNNTRRRDSSLPSEGDGTERERLELKYSPMKRPALREECLKWKLKPSKSNEDTVKRLIQHRLENQIPSSPLQSVSVSRKRKQTEASGRRNRSDQ